MKVITINQEIKIYHHRTWEIVRIINNKCDLIITMNITYSLAKKLCDKNKTRIYFVSCSRGLEDIAKISQPVATSHMKLYQTNDKLYISTANLSLSNWNELTIEVQRTEELDKFVREIENNLQKKNNYIVHFW